MYLPEIGWKISEKLLQKNMSALSESDELKKSQKEILYKHILKTEFRSFRILHGNSQEI